VQSRSIQWGIAFSLATAYSLIMDPITTARLRLVPATLSLIELEISDLSGFFETLGVGSIPDWPSNNLAPVLPLFRDQLEAHPSWAGWLSWYWILDGPDVSHLVGGGGFKGAPTDGCVEIGYETRLSYRRMEFATEAVNAQVLWALDHDNVTRVTAETRADNAASIGVLKKLRFVRIDVESKDGLLHFERRTQVQHKSASTANRSSRS